MNTNFPNPTIETHIPKTQEIPSESNDLAVGRADAPTPSLWQRSVKVVHKVTKKPAIVHRVDWGTNMFRAFYPTEGETDPNTGLPQGRFSERTEWEHCRDWDVEVTWSPKELERQAARKKLEEEINKLDAASIASVTVLCDDPDPAKALAKLEAMRAMGWIKGPAPVVAAAVEKKRGRPGTLAEAQDAMRQAQHEKNLADQGTRRGRDE